MFDEGKLDYTDVMQDVRIQPCLTKTNLKQVYHNVFQNYSSTLSHVKNSILITNQYFNLLEEQRCCYPILQFLQFENINIEEFMKSIFAWLSCIKKKNCLCSTDLLIVVNLI